MSDTVKALREAREKYGLDHPLTKAAFDARVAEMLAEEDLNPKWGVWWLSVAAEEFGGVCLVLAHGPMHARWMASPAPAGELAIYGPFEDGDDIPRHVFGVWVTDKEKAERFADGDFSVIEKRD